MDHHVEFFEPWAAKRKTCLHRPEFMLRLMDRYQRPLVWLDADCELLDAIEIPDGPAGLVRNPRPGNPHMAAVFMARERAFLEHWHDLCAQWRPGEIGSHRRLCWTASSFDWSDMTPHVRGRFVLRTRNREWAL